MKIVEILCKKEKYNIILDDEDYEKLKSCKFVIRKSTTTCDLIYCDIIIDKKQKSLHRYIMNVTDSKVVIDHINHNGLDNRRENLRVCSNAENSRNSRKQSNPASSIYKGVHLNINTQKYESNIKFNYRKISLGCYDTELDAAKAYDAAAKLLFKEFACLNFPDVEPNVLLFNEEKLIEKSKRPTRTEKYCYFHKSSQSWHACICINKKKHSFGYYKTQEEATAASYEFRKLNKIGKEFNNGR